MTSSDSAILGAISSIQLGATGRRTPTRPSSPLYVCRRAEPSRTEGCRKLRHEGFTCAAPPSQYLSPPTPFVLRALGLGCGCDDGDLHEGRELRQHDGVVARLDDANVLHGLEQPRLVIEQQHHAVGRVDEPLPAACRQHARGRRRAGLSKRARFSALGLCWVHKVLPRHSNSRRNSKVC